ncbi:MAG: response regulator [Candidatus Omnitrophica bacterium]|nr:response regulator [Candidatus Omnitrophota bacterium]
MEDTWEDARILQGLLARELGTAFDLRYVDRLGAGLECLAEGGIDLVLLDLNLPDSKGLETISRLLERAPSVPVVVLTASDDEASVVQALHEGAQDYLVKGYVQVYPKMLGRSIRYAIERKRAEEEVRNAHGQTEKLLASIPSILIGVSPDGRLTHWNAIAQQTLGCDPAQVLNRPLADCRIPWDVPRILEALATCRTTEAITRLDDVAFTYPDGRQGCLGFVIRPIRSNGEAQSGFLLFGADITERKLAELERTRLQEQLVQAQKMETIGRFAGGIAHDFNNFLQVIMGFAKVIRNQHGKKSPELVSDLDEIINAANSAADMVQQLLAFSRRHPIQPQLLELNQTVQEMTASLQRFVGDRISVTLVLAPQPLPVKMDLTGLKQILMNLSSNARDAMPGGGRLIIRTATVRVEADRLTQHPPAAEGAYARLSVQDTGVGMDPKVASRIFEPFFTTKGVGSGTGLGLAVVYGLVRQHQGLIDHETAPGNGTTFHLYFPLQSAALEPPRPASGGASTADAPGSRISANGQRSKRRILVVDDKQAIRVLCERILREGYEVTTASSASAAMKCLAREPFDLLLTDLKMPEVDGFALIEEAAKLRPDLKLLAMTGSLTVEFEQRLSASTFPCALIRKPFTPLMLEEAVRRAL